MKGRMNFTTYAKIVESAKYNQAMFGKQELAQLKQYLHVFAESGNSTMVKLLLENGASINGTALEMSHGRLPLEYQDEPFRSALKGGFLNIAKLLIEKGAKPRTESMLVECGEAIKHGNTQVVEYLLRNFLSERIPLDIDETVDSQENHILRNILTDAVNADNIKIWGVIAKIIPLAQTKMRLNVYDSETSNTAYGFIIYRANLDRKNNTLQFFESPINKNPLDVEFIKNYLRLHIYKQPESAVLEVIKHLSPDIEQQKLIKFLSKAITLGYKNLVKTLVPKIKDINFEDKISMFVDKKGQIHDTQHTTLLENALENGRYEIAKTLIERGAKLNFPPDVDNVKLNYFVSQLTIDGDVRCVKLCLKHKIIKIGAL